MLAVDMGHQQMCSGGQRSLLRVDRLDSGLSGQDLWVRNISVSSSSNSQLCCQAHRGPVSEGVSAHRVRVSV